MSAGKAELRQWARAMGQPLSSKKLCQAVIESPWFQQANSVMAFWAMPQEVDLRPVIDLALAQGKTLALPRCEAGYRLTARRVDRLELLIPGVFGILEPGPDAPVLPPPALDLILVPALAFDRMGRRLGRGKGYYDRFLQGYNGRTIGVSGVIAPQVPVEAHDVPVDAVATEDGLILCRLEDKAYG